MAAGVNVPLKFEIHQGDQPVRTETLTQDVIKIGKLSSSHLRIDDEGVSLMHAVIEVAGADDISIIDLGSSKGTLVNGQKVTKGKLKSGDEISLGSARLVVTVGEPVAAEEKPQARRETVMGMAVAAIPTPSAAAPVPAAAATVAVAAPASAARAPLPPVRAADPNAIEVRDGSQAIEVMAMFEDAIVEARHFTNPKSGVVQPVTKALIVGGAAALLAALALFFAAWWQVSAMKAAQAAWEVAHKDTHGSVNEYCNNFDNRGEPDYIRVCPQRESPVADIAAVVLLISGLAGLGFGLFRRQDELQPCDFTIGPDAKALFNAPGELLPVALFPLVRSTGSSYELLFTDQMKGDVQLDGKLHTLAELVASGKASGSSIGGARAYAIPAGARIKVDLGETTFLVNSVPPPRRHPVPLSIDWRANSYTGGAFVVAGLFLALIFSIPPDAKSLSLDDLLNDQRFAQFLVKPPEEKQEEIPDWLKKKNDDEAGGKGKRHKDEEGKMGKKDSKKKQGLYALKGPPDNPDPHLAKKFAEDQAKDAGVLGILKSDNGSILASAFGRDSALGTDAENVMGGLVGTQIGEAYGVGGLGLVGSGRGGGGTGEGTIGLGNLGTIGKGGGGGSGSGYGRGAGGLGGRRAHAPDVIAGTALVRGSLDKEIIRRVIRRHINEVRFCYEKELVTKPNLYGRVMIQFIIAGDGHVMASLVQNSTMGNPTVEQCIAGAVKRWEFPKPQGGGIVQVSYPFVLKAAGG